MSEFESYLQGWRKRWRAQERADAEAAVRARQIADRLARRLHEEFGARRVVLVGSLARGQFGIGSDIDLAAEGIPDEVFFRAGADIEADADGLRVDLIPIESANALFLADLAREGVVLYDG
jgi:uncharacterized protein